MLRKKVAELILQEHISLYRNAVNFDECTGHLSAFLEVFPAPRIVWDYESLGSEACFPEELMYDQRLDCLSGVDFSLEGLVVRSTSHSLSPGFQENRIAFHGLATKANLGNQAGSFQEFVFYFPNARFHEVNVVGQGTLTQYFRARLGENTWETNKGTAGRFIDIPLECGWHLHLETRQDALKWLNVNEQNVGTKLTTIGSLYSKQDDESANAATQLELTLDEGLEKLETISRLLSFVNGGYLGPLYVEGINLENHRSAAQALPYRTTPLELLGDSWFVLDSDFFAYMACLPTFEKMLSISVWKEAFDPILMWYFQAIQPENFQSRGKPWPIVANSIGAALERLSASIIVGELNRHGSANHQKLRDLLELIGVSDPAEQRLVDEFLAIRNAATHPIADFAMPFPRISRVLSSAIQWVEEIILWRLGYDGKYRNRRSERYSTISPRYELSTRLSSW